jgi:coenzyme F420-reducing hydrogenase delta subunit
LHNIEENYDTARAFANRGKQKTAANILIAMTENLSKSDDRYEMMERDIGLYLSETKDKADAYKALNAYLITYGEDADYSLDVQKALDSLFYAPEDANKTALLAEYENLESKYANEEIGQKAALEKAKLLQAEKQYQAVLDMKGSGVENEEAYEAIETSSALALAMDSLEKGRCSNAIVLSNEYNLTIESKFDKELYDCAFTTGNYELAKRTAVKHLKDGERLDWLYKYAKTLNKLGEYKELIKVSKDVVTLSALDKTDKYDDILQDTFYAEQRMGNTQGMITTIKELERRRGLVYDDIEPYVEMIKLGLKQHDDVIIETYAKKVMKLQKKTSSYSQSPFVEFAALQVLKAQKKEKEQMSLLKELIKREMTEKERSRAQYMLGSLLMKENKNKEAKIAFEASIKADEKSAWAGLSKDALDLL